MSKNQAAFDAYVKHAKEWAALLVNFWYAGGVCNDDLINLARSKIREEFEKGFETMKDRRREAGGIVSAKMEADFLANILYPGVEIAVNEFRHLWQERWEKTQEFSKRDG
jgi:hypothetical protein